jgi:hypothetical protein
MSCAAAVAEGILWRFVWGEGEGRGEFSEKGKGMR